MKKNTLKKLLALVLGIVMLSSCVLTSCKKEETEVDADYRETFSLVLALVCEEEVSAETEKLIETAFTAITESKYKTRIDLRFYTPDEYYTELTAMIERMNTKDDASVTTPPTEETAPLEEETLIDEEYGYSVFKYPEIKEDQVDIFYINGAAMYAEFIEKGYLAKLDTALTTSSKVLLDYIFPEYMEAAKYNSLTYAVPNNCVAGDYKYMLVNKELAEKYQYSASLKNWTTLSSAEAFIEDIAAYETGVLPLYGTPEPVNVHNWTYEIGSLNGITTFKLVPSEFSVFGTTIASDCNLNTVLGFGKTLTGSYGTQIQFIQKLKDKNYISETLADGQEFAVGFVKGNEKDVINYREDYEVIVLEKPKMTSETVYDNMFGVYSYMSDDSERTTRCMEVLTLINTDAEARNLIQYGIEGTHYEINEKTGVLTRLNRDYIMDINKTGNVFMAHTEEGVDPIDLEYMRQQNIDACVYPTINIFFPFPKYDKELGEYEKDESGAYVEKMNAECVKKTNEISKKYADKIAACKNSEELAAVIDEFRRDSEVSALQTTWIDEMPLDGKLAPYAVYYSWLVDNGLVDDE